MWRVGFSPRWLLLWQSTGCRECRLSGCGLAHQLSCSTACEIFPDQGSNLHPLHRQADSQPLNHQGSPLLFVKGEHLQTSPAGREGHAQRGISRWVTPNNPHPPAVESQKPQNCFPCPSCSLFSDVLFSTQSFPFFWGQNCVSFIY